MYVEYAVSECFELIQVVCDHIHSWSVYIKPTWLHSNYLFDYIPIIYVHVPIIFTRDVCTLNTHIHSSICTLHGWI